MSATHRPTSHVTTQMAAHVAAQVSTHCRAASALLLDAADSAPSLRVAAKLDEHSGEARALASAVLANPSACRRMGEQVYLLKGAVEHCGVPNAAAQLQAALVLAKKF